jgi:hypothetical protein
LQQTVLQSTPSLVSVGGGWCGTPPRRALLRVITPVHRRCGGCHMPGIIFHSQPSHNTARSNKRENPVPPPPNTHTHKRVPTGGVLHPPGTAAPLPLWIGGMEKRPLLLTRLSNKQKALPYTSSPLGIFPPAL